MKKTKFLSLFLALAMLIVPNSMANIIGTEAHNRLRSVRLYHHLKTGLERNIMLALRDTTAPYIELEESLLKLFGAYCLIVADHIHWSPITTHSARVPAVPRARIPKDINRVFELQRSIREKLSRTEEAPHTRENLHRYRVPRACILNWSYAGRRYLCNPDLVYDRLPRKYRKESLELVRILSNFSAPRARPTVHRPYLTI